MWGQQEREYMCFGVSRSIKNESKMQPKVAWGRKNSKSRGFGIFESGGEVLGEENVPLPLF